MVADKLLAVWYVRSGRNDVDTITLDQGHVTVDVLPATVEMDSEDLLWGRSIEKDGNVEQLFKILCYSLHE